jgi:predicted ATPase/class 3 adenylate cyclase
VSQELATVLFTDVEGSTDLRTRRGDDAAHRRLQALHEAVTQEIEHHGGRVIKALGDGVLALFRSPRTAVTSSVAIQREIGALNRAHPDEVLRVRIGINTGEVLEESGDVFGEAVNAAARIAALAEGGQTLVSAVVRDLVGTMGDVDFEGKGSYPLKGFPDEWVLNEVISEETPQITFLDKTPFVGREAELGQLERVLEQVIRNRGAVLLIGGEPGVGKTRLAEEVTLRAQQRGMLSFTGHCYEMEAALPYAPFVEILEATAETIPADVFRDVMGDSAPELARFAPQIQKMFPDIPPPADLPGEEERRYTFNSISRYMRRAAVVRPIMLVLDDLHWGDESTLLLLEHLALNLHDVPVLIVGTYRDVELAVSRPLSRTLETLVRQRAAQRLSLKRLSEQDVAAMLHRLSGSEPPQPLVAAIYSETEGNAFFVEEVFRHLLEEEKLLDARGIWRSGLQIDELDVPEGVRLVIGRRLERLRAETRKVLTVAAVIGRVFEFDLLPAITDLSELDPLDAMDEAERAHLITAMKGRDPRYSFVHELVRQTLLTDISLPRRQRLHLQIAEAIETKHASNLDRYTSDLAHHLYQSGAAADPEKTVSYLIRAGDHAQSIAASEDALRGYEAALSLVEDDLQRGQLLYKIGRARRGLPGSDSQAAFEEALDIFERLGEKDRFVRTGLMIADRQTFAGEWSNAIAVLQRALDMAGDQQTTYTGAALALQSVALTWAGRYTESRSRLEEAGQMAEELDDPRLRVGVL